MTLTAKLDAMDTAIANAQAGADGEDGASAYEIAIANGYTGTVTEWLDSLHGTDGTDGADGADGASAYDIAVANGYNGTVSEWLESLHGAAGADGLNGEDGADGASAYELAVSNGYTGTLTQWLASLEGEPGTNGTDGTNGEDGTTVVVGTTTTGAAGTNASVTGTLNESTNTLTLNFTIPKGETGESGTSASITAEEVLTKIKTVDGANSGLDADTLDGIESSGFSLSSHTHSNYATTTALSELETAVNGKANATHTHSNYATTSDIETLQTAIAGKANTNHTHSNYATSDHSHSNYATTSALSTLQTTVSGKADTNHTHSNYATITSLNDKADISHIHAQSDITGLETALSAKAAADHVHTAYATAIHTHAQSDISGLSTILDGKASASHTHTQSEIIGLTTALNGKANTDHIHDDYVTTSDFESGMNTKSNITHTHSGYATTTALTEGLNGKADTGHTHANYASSTHNHDTVYASASHTHTTLNNDLNVVGLIKCKGNQMVFINDTSGTVILGTNNLNTIIGGKDSVTINGTETFTGHLLSRGAGNFNIGSASNRFKAIYLTNSPNVSSDERLKENIKGTDREQLADFINNIDVVKYNYIADKDKQERIGVVAQQLMKADKEIANYLVDVDDSEEHYLSVKPADLVFPLIATVQQLKKEIEELKKQ